MFSEDHGRFCWHDLMTTDPAAAREFYGALFGWRVEPMDLGGGTYHMLKAGERGLGGIVPLDPGDGLPAHWMPYVAVDDIAAACAAATALGGQVCVPPTDLGFGVMAVITDPQGGALSFWQAKDGLGEPAPVGTPHVFGWNECLSSDATAGAAFYAGVFGWRPEAGEMTVAGATATYRVFWHGDDHSAGIMDLPPEAVAQGARTHWLPYVNVADVDASARRAGELGATLLCPPTDIPDVGRFCVVADPQGASLALFADR